MEKTPLAQLIEKLLMADDKSPHLGFNLAAKWAKELLPAERKMVEDAFEDGYSDDFAGALNNDYFDQNYEQ